MSEEFSLRDFAIWILKFRYEYYRPDNQFSFSRDCVGPAQEQCSAPPSSGWLARSDDSRGGLRHRSIGKDRRRTSQSPVAF
jgi:hypothetical protein